MKITEKDILEASELLIKNEWEIYGSDVKFGIETGFTKGVEWTNERLKVDREIIHEQYKGMGLDILCLVKMLGDRKLSSTEKVVLENIRQSQSKRLRLLKDLPIVEEVKAEMIDISIKNSITEIIKEVAEDCKGSYGEYCSIDSPHEYTERIIKLLTK